MKLYNLFPTLAGPFDGWQPHLERAAAMGFDWVLVNPIQRLGRSGSLYSIADYFAINPVLVAPSSPGSPEDQVRRVIRAAGRLGLRMMTDLVINHCAVDSPLATEHPEWLVRDQDGRPANPFCVEEDGNRVVWRDLAQLDHRHSPDREGLLRWCGDLVEYLIGLGFTGFRCDAAYQIPRDFWIRLMERIRRAHPDTLFVAETLGCSPQQTRDTASAGFDLIYNSSKWWDFGSPWLLEQYEMTRHIVGSISFPESHDTERLYQESGGNEAAMRQRYLFAAVLSVGVMIPMGYEFGFRRRLHVVETGPGDWERPNIDLTDFIARVNRAKSAYPVLGEESLVQPLDSGNPAVLLMWKAAVRGQGEALLILNKDPWGRQIFYSDNLYRNVQSRAPLRDVSPEWPMEHIPPVFHYELPPGVGRILVSD
jgi:starch synthase (maltosyl-transferring)